MILTLLGFFVVSFVLFYIVFFLYSDSDVTLFFCEHFGRKLSYFRGKVVWITGASRGIGEALAVELAKNGAKLVLTARTVPDLERVKKRCLESSSTCKPDNILVLPLNIMEYAKHEKLLNQIIKHFGKLDIFVSNAGRSQRAIWENIDIEVDKEIFELNVFSVINLSRVVIRYFKKTKKGHIVIMSSLCGVYSQPLTSSYSATKHALQAYFKGLYAEKGRHLLITLLCPGPVFSNLLSECFTEKLGEKFGENMKSTDNRLSAERCAKQCAISIANKLPETWMGLFPVLPLFYAHAYYPTFSFLVMSLLGSTYLHKLRDNRVIKQ